MKISSIKDIRSAIRLAMTKKNVLTVKKLSDITGVLPGTIRRRLTISKDIGMMTVVHQMDLLGYDTELILRDRESGQTV